MPKLKRRAGPYDAMIIKIQGQRDLLELTYDDLAPAMGASRQTVASRCRDPEKMTLGELRKLTRALSIPAEEMRALIPFGG